MGFVEEVIEGPVQFYREAERLLIRCTKPDIKEYTKVVQAVGMGFLVMGFIGFFVKLVHIPINNIIVSN